MKAFGWEKGIGYYKYIRVYFDKRLAAGISSYRDGYKLFYNSEVYLVEIDKRKYTICKTFEDAKYWCDQELNEAGVKMLSEEYRALM
jgi:hypothetical protein